MVASPEVGRTAALTPPVDAAAEEVAPDREHEFDDEAVEVEAGAEVVAAADTEEDVGIELDDDEGEADEVDENAETVVVIGCEDDEGDVAGVTITVEVELITPEATVRLRFQGSFWSTYIQHLRTRSPVCNTPLQTDLDNSCTLAGNSLPALSILLAMSNNPRPQVQYL
ncbi:hypothetical protein MMC20_001258 [Loxospora ochrophaea]|nr:hypothetical protein [Loxospora ochrophaea]